MNYPVTYVKLPASNKVYHVFHRSLLAADAPMSHCSNPLPAPPIMINDEPKYEVTYILDSNKYQD